MNFLPEHLLLDEFARSSLHPTRVPRNLVVDGPHGLGMLSGEDDGVDVEEIEGKVRTLHTIVTTFLAPPRWKKEVEVFGSFFVLLIWFSLDEAFSAIRLSCSASNKAFVRRSTSIVGVSWPGPQRSTAARVAPLSSTRVLPAEVHPTGDTRKKRRTLGDRRLIEEEVGLRRPCCYHQLEVGVPQGQE